MSEFLHMGGYAFYVWSSFGITFLVMAAGVIYTLIQQKKTKQNMSKRLKQKRGDV